ncbi:hypothetical protein QE152_g37624 [Popillia japonica]|uniref:CCHC-type domain-containing protein n=1 Tax=Popillia japonica TaxID=7064 RepID=A0AAW1I961_POPJA
MWNKRSSSKGLHRRKDLCLKCGTRDHRAKDCTGESFCLTCKRAGHRADQTRCPYYRKLIYETTKATVNTKGREKEYANKKSDPKKSQSRAEARVETTTPSK